MLSNAEDSGLGGPSDNDNGIENEPHTVAFLDQVGQRHVDSRSCCQRLGDQILNSCRTVTKRDVAVTLVPPLRWLTDYNIKTDLIKDLLGGMTICVLLIPQGMAYGQLASLPPIYGLYTAFFAPLLYLCFGTCRQLSFGTMAVITIMTGAVVETVAPKHYHPGNNTVHGEIDVGDDPAFIAVKVSVCASAAFLMGLVQLCLGLFRFGYIAALLPEPLTRSFTTGCAVYVFCSELKHFFGLTDPHGVRPQRERGIFGLPWTIYDTARGLPGLNWGSFVIGCVTVLLLLLFKDIVSPAIKKKWQAMPMEIPIDILVVVLTTLLSWCFDFRGRFDVDVVGVVPTGFPTPTVPNFSYIADMVPDCIVLAIVGFAISISLAKIVAKKNDYQIEPNVDLIAYGVSNLGASFFTCMPASGCISRTMLLDSLGVRSQLQAVVSCIVMLLVLLVLDKYVQWLPDSVLAAIIMVAIRKMFLQVTDLPKLWRISKPDVAIWVVTFLSTVLLGVPYGLLVGVPFSLGIVMTRNMVPPRVRLLGRVAATGTFEDSALFDAATQILGVRVVRLESSLFYATAEATRDAILKVIGIDLIQMKKAKMTEEEVRARTLGRAADTAGLINSSDQHPGEEDNNDVTVLTTSSRPTHLVIDCAQVAFIDFVAVMTLGQIIKDLGFVGVQVYLSSCTPSVVSVIRNASESEISDDILFVTIHDALKQCEL